MSYYHRLVGKKCYLSPIAKEDAEKWAVWFNDLEVSIPLGSEAYTMQPYGLQQQEVEEFISSKASTFAVVDLATDELIGRVMLFNVNQVDRSAQLGVVIGEKAYWNSGYGTEAMSLLADYAFNLLNLNSLMLGTYEFNQRAIACYQKVGFKEIGRRRQARIIAGKKYDAVLMDLLAEEFNSPFVAELVQRIT